MHGRLSVVAICADCTENVHVRVWTKQQTRCGHRILYNINTYLHTHTMYIPWSSAPSAACRGFATSADCCRTYQLSRRTGGWNYAHLTSSAALRIAVPMHNVRESQPAHTLSASHCLFQLVQGAPTPPILAERATVHTFSACELCLLILCRLYTRPALAYYFPSYTTAPC